MPMVTGPCFCAIIFILFSSPMLVIRGVGNPGIRSGQLEKSGAIKLWLGTQNANLSTIHPLPLSAGSDRRQHHFFAEKVGSA